MLFGDKIKELRDENGVLQRQLASSIWYSSSSVKPSTSRKRYCQRSLVSNPKTATPSEKSARNITSMTVPYGHTSGSILFPLVKSTTMCMFPKKKLIMYINQKNTSCHSHQIKMFGISEQVQPQYWLQVDEY